MSRRAVLLALLVVASVLVAGPAGAVGTTRYVDDAGGCDDTDGDPFYCTIQAAVNDAVDGDVIEVAAGTYVGLAAFVVDNFDVDITINGAGEGLTIIDGQNVSGGIRISGHDATITGLTVVNASVTGSGAGITIQNPTDVVPRPKLTLTDVTVQNGAATYSAAGILIAYDTMAELLRVTIDQNSVVPDTGPPQGAGGGMSILADTVVKITDSSFTSNRAETNGGAIAIGGNSDLTITRTYFALNSANDSGGGIASLSTGTQLIVTGSHFDTNAADNGAGGAIFFNQGDSLVVEGSTFESNTALDDGGAIEDSTVDDLTVRNSTFFDNSGDQGGAIRTSGLIANSTIAGNQAGSNGGGVATNGFTGPILRNSIVANNTAVTSGPDCYFAVSQGYNLIESTSGCSLSGDTTGNLTGTDPALGALGDYTGPTPTMLPGGSSPVINAANPAEPGTGGTTCELVDQRGYLRYDTRCDIGAVEYNTGPNIFRISGANRYGTAAGVSEFDFPDPDQVSVVFVAVGTNYPDALAGAAIAGKIGAPLLLVEANAIPAETATELTRLTPDDIVILGGTGVISQQVEDDLDAYATNPATRLAGADRFATAVAISQYGFAADGSADTVIVATGRAFADALAGGPLATQLNGPVLLTEPGSLPAAVGAEIVRLTPSRIIVVGGGAAVSDAVLTALDALQVGDVVERIAGADRYATAAAISQEAFELGAFRAYVATGLNFPDALAGAAVAGWRDGPVLLVPGTSLPTATSAEITRLGAKTVIILGGLGVVSQSVEDDLAILIG